MLIEQLFSCFQTTEKFDIFAVEYVCDILGSCDRFIILAHEILIRSEVFYDLEEINRSLNDNNSELYESLDPLLRAWLAEFEMQSSGSDTAYRDLCHEVRQQGQQCIPELDLSAESCIALWTLQQYNVVRRHPGKGSWEPRMKWFSLHHQSPAPG